MEDPTVKYMGWDCKIQFHKYRNGSLAMRLVSTYDTQEPIATASVNLANGEVKPGEIAIKDYSENDGMLQTLISHGIVSEPIRYIRTGYIEIPICNLLVTPDL